MNKISLLFTMMLVFMGAAIKANAQNGNKAQMTFFYPIGSAGLHATDDTYHFSFNTLYGMTGGVNGFEMGGIGNVVRGRVKGLQLAGVFNAVTPKIPAGSFQTTKDSSLTMVGVQVSGVGNWVKGNQKGWQLAGVCNTTTGNSSGVILSGISTIIGKAADGVLISGVVNLSETLQGLQLSTINLAAKQINGAQIGVINIAPRGKGFQLGVVNIGQAAHDSIIPLGVINIFKDGYYAFELSTNDAWFSQLSYKMGIKKLYTLFQFGARFHDQTQFYSAGAGLGSICNITSRNKINLELITTQFFAHDFTYIPDFLNQANVDYQFDLTRHIALKIGPSFNCYIEKNNSKTDSPIRIPYSLVEAKGRYHTTSIWIGGNAGVVITL